MSTTAEGATLLFGHHIGLVIFAAGCLVMAIAAVTAEHLDRRRWEAARARRDAALNRGARRAEIHRIFEGADR